MSEWKYIDSIVELSDFECAHCDTRDFCMVVCDTIDEPWETLTNFLKKNQTVVEQCSFNKDEIIPLLKSLETASADIIKLNIIRRALNLGENMEFTKGNIYYPYNPFITKSSTYYDNEIKEGLMSVVAEFEYKDQRYRLVGGVAGGGSASGLGCFGSYGGVSFADVSFLGCATREIAQHFGKYFAKEIFDAKYGDTVKYQWIR